MSPSQIAADMIALRQRLAALQRRFHAGERSALHAEARVLTDQVVCLLEEAPARKRGALNRLADRCEAMLRALVH